MARPTVITPRIEEQLERLLDAGVTQELGPVVGISTRRVIRSAARQRTEEAQTIEELVAALPSVAEVLDDVDRPRSR